MIRHLHADDAPACDAIIAGLADWFGDPDGIHECAVAVRTQPGLVEAGASGPKGFLTFSRVDQEAEITWMAVAADARRRGIGERLLAALVEHLRGLAVERLMVKTLSDREDPGPAYAQTRAFYLAMGFLPEAELDIWGPENPAQLLVKRL
jgi:GNAT superfamily N-acetyltransferase